MNGGRAAAAGSIRTAARTCRPVPCWGRARVAAAATPAPPTGSRGQTPTPVGPRARPAGDPALHGGGAAWAAGINAVAEDKAKNRPVLVIEGSLYITLLDGHWKAGVMFGA